MDVSTWRGWTTQPELDFIRLSPDPSLKTVEKKGKINIKVQRSKQYKMMKAEWWMLQVDKNWGGHRWCTWHHDRGRNLEGRALIITESLKKGGRGLWKVWNSTWRWLQLGEADRRCLCSSCLFWGPGPPKNNSGDLTSLQAVHLLSLWEGKKVFDYHMRCRFGMSSNLTPLSNFTFWNIYSSFCAKLHSSKRSFSVGQSMFVCN